MFESDADAGAALEPKSLDKESAEVTASPVPMPRRRKTLLPPKNKTDEMKAELEAEAGKQKKVPPKRPAMMPTRYREKGTDEHEHR